MFTLKFGTGKTITAQSVEETYRSGVNGKAMYLVFSEVTDHDVDWYKAIMTEEGALDTIEVSADEMSSVTYKGYTELDYITIRLLSNGEKSMSASLTRLDPAE